MSWRILYIEESDRLSLHLDNISIDKDKQNILIPISDIHTLILDNYKIMLSVHLINALAKANINVVVCGVNHLPLCIIRPIVGHYQQSLNIVKQFNWNSNMKSLLHQKIIINKIKNQKETLKHLGLDLYTINTVDKFQSEVEPSDATNREGLTAKMYFRAMFGDGFKRFNEDIINWGLNYGYSILRSQIAKSVVGKGLNTSLGIFHIGRENEFNLCDDIIEVFRPIIDIWVKKNLIDKALFLREHRLSLVEQTTKHVKINGQVQTIFNAINIYVDGIITCFETQEIIHFKEVSLKFDEL